MDVCGGDRDRPRGGGNRGGDDAAVGGVYDRCDGGGGEFGGVGRVTVVGKMTDGGKVDATVVAVEMMDRGEQDPRMRRLTAPGGQPGKETV